MATQDQQDAQLMEQIARGDWARPVPSPSVSDVTALVARRRRRRQMLGYGGSALVGCAAVTTLVLALQPNHGSAPAPALPPASQTQVWTTAPQLPRPCSRAHLLISAAAAGTSGGRRAVTFYTQNIGSSVCRVRGPQEVTVGAADIAVRVDVSRAAGSWILKSRQALFLTLADDPRPGCIQTPGKELSRAVNVTADGFTYSIETAGLHAVGCERPPVLVRVYVADGP